VSERTDKSTVFSNTRPDKLLWPDLIKGFALLWIFMVHVVERVFGYPYFANPGRNWPVLSERIAQLAPLSGHGALDIPLNLVRYVGWMGDHGVQLFLIVGGFGLTYGLLQRNTGDCFPLRNFYSRRVRRIYPMWIAAHFLLLIFSILTGLVSVSKPAFLVSLLGVRFLPQTFYALSPSWWYIGLLLQLYVIFPLLWRWLHNWGPTKFLFLTCGVAFAVRGLGLVLLWDSGYLDAWSRGAIFITRLPEFAFGMALAVWYFRGAESVDARLRSVWSTLAGVSTLLFGVGLSLTLAGMTFALFLIGVGAFVLLYQFSHALERGASWITIPIVWTGIHSYSLYLTHGTFVDILIPFTPSVSVLPYVVIGVAVAILLTLGSALLLEWIAGGAPQEWNRIRRRLGTARAFSAVLAAALAGLGVMVALNLLVARFDPQEIWGWGERPSLQAHPEFGWNLIPSQETRLRWESYDYVIEANHLGFPGPQYPKERAKHSIRILTVGDAFTSAEGVDTPDAWPRLLETELVERLLGKRVEVLNFGITGYGPNQYASVLNRYVPEYSPDVVLIGFFVNEYGDVLQTDEQFRTSIGFAKASQQGLGAILTLQHLRTWIRARLQRLIDEWFHGKPWGHGYFLGNFTYLERGAEEQAMRAENAVRERLYQISKMARDNSAVPVLAMVPAPVQICGKGDLEYFPRHVDLTDTERFTPDYPQQLTRRLAKDVGIEVIDLRPALESSTSCPYQPRNMHWTEEGHRVVADDIADWLVERGGQVFSDQGTDEARQAGAERE